MSTKRRTLDELWPKQSFLLPAEALDPDGWDMIRRTYTSASKKFTDTTLGGNFVINPMPQFTRFADPKVSSLYAQSKKLGRYYSEVIDDNKQVIHMQMGVPRFNSLSRFFGEFYNVEASSIARKGRGTGAFYTLGRLAGVVVSAPLMPVLLTAKMIRFVLQMPASRYYYFKPTMYPYWNSVASTVNRIATNMGILPRVMTDDMSTKYYDEDAPNREDAALYHKLLPDVYRADGGIDIFAMSNRAQMLANTFQEALENEAGKGKRPREIMDKMASWNLQYKSTNTSLEYYRELFHNSIEGELKTEEVGRALPDVEERDVGWFGKLAEFYKSERRMGADFVSFRVDHTGTQSENFSNSSKQSGIASAINGISSNARSMRFNLADGNLEGTGLIESIVGAATDFMNGVAQSLELQGIAALAGSAFVDIPEIWDTSSADLNRTTFNIPLRSPYGNDMSRLMNLIIPMSMFMSMALPLSTGKQSYTSPFIVQLFNRGRTQIRLGLVESLSFTRGVGDIGWTNTGKFLGVDVSMTVIDLSKVIHMPLQTNFGLGSAAVVGAAGVAGSAVGTVKDAMGFDGRTSEETGKALGAAFLNSSYDEDNVYSDYTATLASLDLASQIHGSRRLRLALTRQMGEFNQWKSPARFISYGMENVLWGIPGDIIKAMSLETARQ